MWGRDSTAPHILKHGTGWRLLVSCMLRPLYPRWKSPLHRAGRCVGPRTGMHVFEKRKPSNYNDCAIPAHTHTHTHTLSLSLCLSLSLDRRTDRHTHAHSDIFFFLFLCWRYNPLGVLAFSEIFFHSVLSLLSFLHSFIPIVWISSSSSIQFFLGLPLILLPTGFHSNILLDILPPSIRIKCPSQAILLFFINFTKFEFFQFMVLSDSPNSFFILY